MAAVIIRCESCRRSYDFDKNDGLCPRCGCYNNISDVQAYRLEARREARWEEVRARQSGSLCDAQDGRTFAGRYAPDCMEDGHDPHHAHTGGIYLEKEDRVLPPVPKVPLSMSRTPVRDTYARKVNGISEPARANSKKAEGKPGAKKSGCGIALAIFWALFMLLELLLEA